MLLYRVAQRLWTEILCNVGVYKHGKVANVGSMLSGANNNGCHAANAITAMFIATVGGGTGLPTQNECLQILDCAGVGKVRKLAEIVAGTVLAGEISLAAAISSLDWVSSHDQLGRNDPTAQQA